MNSIHVAGTKGKGSTSAFISSILSQYNRSTSPEAQKSPSPLKVGLYTSPHLRFARERIKIDNAPLPEEKFARYFFEVWDRLEEAARVAGENPTDMRTKPQYFRYLTLMAFHAYLSEGVDAAVIECGIGGEYDCTNVIPKPVVSAITSLDIDHVAMLGSTIEEIAWHKGGIIRPGVKAVSAPQAAGAEEVLLGRAKERGTQLDIVGNHPELTVGSSVKLGLAGDFQYTNASLAVAAAAEYIRKTGVEAIPQNILKEPLPEKLRKGLEATRLGGRCETRNERSVSWYIDGGHTLESIKLAGQWFASQIDSSPSSAVTGQSPRVLIFNQQTRDSNALAQALHKTLTEALGSGTPFTHAAFCTNVTYKDAGYRPDLVSINTNAEDVDKLRVQKSLAQTWQAVDPRADVRVFNTIEDAVDFTRELAADTRRVSSSGEAAPVKTFVTGSLHLVGGFLDVIETKPEKQDA